MSSPLSFSAACSQLGNAAYNVAQAVWRAPFTGGRIRMVTIGIPVALITLGTGALALRIANSILRTIGNSWSQRSSRSMPPQVQVVERHIPHIPVSKKVAGSEAEHPEEHRIERIPLPAEAAKERNAAFAKLIKLLDDVVIDPWIMQNRKMLDKGKEIDPLFKAMIESPADLKAFLRSIALWQFGMQWQKGEDLYVKGQLPPPPSFKTITSGIKALQLEEEVQEALLALATPLKDDETAEGKVLAFQRIAAQIGNGNGERLATLAIRLSGILKHQPKPAEEIHNEQAKACHAFAVGMNEVVATSFVSVSDIIHGVLRAVKKTSEGKQADLHPVLVAGPDVLVPELTERQRYVQSETEALITSVSQSLREKYSAPLYGKHRLTWDAVATRDLEDRSLTSQFLAGEIVDTALLDAVETSNLSTEQLSAVFFLHAMRIVESKPEFKGFIQRVPESLLRQIQPTLVGLIDKSLGVIEGIDLERTTVRVFEFVGQLLDCCEAVKGCSVQPQDMMRSYIYIGTPPQETPLARALQKGEIPRDRSGEISTLAAATSNIEEQGRAIILQLQEGAHKNVQSYQRNPRQAEIDWVEDKIPKLKRLIRANTTEYNGQWLLSLLERQGMGAQAGWISSILSLKDKIQAFSPALASIFEILIGGVQSFIETKGATSVQEAIDEISSPGPLSSLIAKTMMKSFLGTSTEDTVWKEKLPFLQQTYQFLSPKEKELIDEHLKFFYQNEKLAARTRDLKGSDIVPAAKLLAEEADYHAALADLEKANKELLKDPETNAAQLKELERAYDDLKTKLGLTQFERVKGLVLFVADENLKPVFKFTGGGTVLTAIMTVIQEAFDLLRYKKVVKHLIFTGVDLLVKELEITSGLKPTEADTFRPAESLIDATPSIFEIAEAHSLDGDLMGRIATFVSTCNRSGASGWLATFNYGFSNWTGPKIWGAIKGEFNEKARITSKDVATKAAKEFFDFGKDPNSLSTLIVEALTEHVADPRPAAIARI